MTYLRRYVSFTYLVIYPIVWCSTSISIHGALPGMPGRSTPAAVPPSNFEKNNSNNRNGFFSRNNNNDNNDTNDDKGYNNINDNKRNGNEKDLSKSYVNINDPRPSRPINYQFTRSRGNYENDAKPKLNRNNNNNNNNDNYNYNDDNDFQEMDRGTRLLTQYKSTKKGSLAIALSSTLVGAALGIALAKSSHILPPSTTSMIFAAFFFLSSLSKYKPPNAGNPNKSPTNPFSLLTQTLGLTLILLLQRTSNIRQSFPSKPHLQHMMRPSRYPRQPFPPADLDSDNPEDSNPFKYEIQPNDSIYMEQYSMFKILAAMALVGAISFANIPLIPTWMGGLAGAIVLVYIATLRNSKGDLGRSMGMKVVSLISELFMLNEDLEVLPKTIVVLNICLDKLLILDRKHSIRDKLTRALKWSYNQAMGVINTVRADVEGAQNKDDNDNDNDDDDRRGRRNNDRDRNVDRDRDRDRNNRGDRQEQPPPPSRDYRPDFFKRNGNDQRPPPPSQD